MTAKRFTITQDFEEHHRQIRDNGKIIMGCFLEPQAEPIVKLLNELHEENQIKLEIIDAFILGMEDEKGIAPEDKEFQCRMNHTIRVLKRLKEDMLNPTDFKRLKEENEYLEGNVNEL